MITIVIDKDGPPNHLRRISEIWAIVSTDEGGEGLCASQIDGTWWPLLAADEQRLAWIKEQAALLGRHSGRRVKLIKFEARIDLEEFPGPEIAA